MGKKKEGSSLGRSLIRDRFGSRHRNGNNSMLHTSELNDGYDWGRLNLQSVTEESSFKEFLSTAELAGTEFQAEKLNIKFINSAVGAGLLAEDEKKQVETKHSELRDLLKIPRRPKWDASTTSEQLQINEKADFLEWRRKLATLQETEGLLLTPYEKNLDFWRQLWRVVERSDIVAQILDARNPLMFRCEDLERYVKEVDRNKTNLLILNKADFLTREQRRAWAKHFDACQVRVMFFSAVLAAEGTIPEEPEEDELSDNEEVFEEGNDSEYETEEEEEIIGDEGNTYDGKALKCTIVQSDNEEVSKEGNDIEHETEEKGDEGKTYDGKALKCITVQSDNEEGNDSEYETVEEEEIIGDEGKTYDGKALKCTIVQSDNEEVSKEGNDIEHETEEKEDIIGDEGNTYNGKALKCTIVQSDNEEVSEEGNDSEYETVEEEEIIGDEDNTYDGKNSSKLMDREELISNLKSLLPKSHPRFTEGLTTVGLVGYPNVGKSSTINSILQNKKVSVSATPGKTKHFQTLFVDQELMLCDCPGLVMPSFVCTKADMIVHGILPVDQMKDHVPPVNLLTSLIPRDVLQAHYSIMIPKPLEGEDPDRPPTAEEFLNAYGYSRGFMTQNGQPDNPRSARYVLKDLLCGKLLYCQAPPGVPQGSYHTWTVTSKHIATPTPAMNRAVRINKVSGEDLDQTFFRQTSLGAHTKGIMRVGHGSQPISNAGSMVSLNSIPAEDKPWKNHKEKRNKKEKLRRVYRHLDLQ